MDQIEALDELLHPIASDSGRKQVLFLAIFNGITTAILLGCFAYQQLTKHKFPNFWLMRLTNYTGYDCLTVNIFSLWLPICSIASGLEMGASIWKLQNMVPGGDQTNTLIFYMLPLLILIYLGWVAAASIIFSGLSVYILEKRKGGDQHRISMPNSYLYHGVSFVFPTCIFVAFLVMTFLANDHSNKAAGPGESLLQGLRSGRIDVPAYTVFKYHSDLSNRLVDAVRYISLAMIITMTVFFEPAAVALILAIRKSAKMRSASITSGGSRHGLANTKRVLVIYTVYTSIWQCLMIYQLISMAVYDAKGDTSAKAIFISYRLSSFINSIGAFTSAIILGGRSFLARSPPDQLNSRHYPTKSETPSQSVPLHLLSVTTHTHVVSDEDEPIDKSDDKRMYQDSHATPFA